MTTVIKTSDFTKCLQKGLNAEIKNLKNRIDLSLDPIRVRSMKQKLRLLTWIFKIVKSGDDISKMVLIEILEMEIRRHKRELSRAVMTRPEEVVYDAIESLEWLRIAIISTDTKKFNNIPFYKETILSPSRLVIT